MYLNLIILTFLAAFANQAFGAPQWGGQGEHSYPSTQCYTTVTNTPWPSTTQWSEWTAPCTDTTTSTKTVTSSGSVRTVSSTTTTVVTATTSTLTDTSTVVISSTATSTTTESSTTVTVTTGFIPVQSSLPNSTYSGSGGIVVKRDTLDLRLSNAGTSNYKTGNNGIQHPGMSRKYYPREINCYNIRQPECSKSVTTTTTTVTAPPSTKTTTITDTSTNYPSATTTVTTTTTSVTTTIITATPTTTVQVPGSYTANCDANNFADTVGGQQITGSDNIDPTGSPVFTETADAQSCCVAALAIPAGQMFIFFTEEPEDNCGIWPAPSDTCSGQSSGRWLANLTPDLPQLIVGNLACGEYTDTDG